MVKRGRSGLLKILSFVQIVLFMLVALILFSGCSGKESEKPVPGTPGVTEEQAKQVAYDEYGVTKIDEVNIRHLTDDELNLRSDEQSQLTPIYYVINGLIEDKQITVYVSSNEVTHHFSIQ